MTVIATVEAIAIVTLAWLLIRHHAQQAAAWTIERRELLNRIQRPDLIPLAAPIDFAVPEPERDDAELVGTIHFGDFAENDNGPEPE